jgi:hypothetical protein
MKQFSICPLEKGRIRNRRGHRKPRKVHIENCCSAGALLALLLCAAAAADAQTIDGVVTSSDGRLSADLTFQWDKPEEAVASLQNGLESRIVFTVQLFQKGHGVYPFNADRLIAQKTVRHSAFWDFLDTVFVVEEEGGASTICHGTAGLVQSFFSSRGTFLYDFAGRRHPPLYVAARAQYEPVRLMPPLTLVNLVGAASNITTPWVRIDVP